MRVKNENKAYTDLFKKLGVTQTAYHEPIAVGKGFVRVFKEKPRKLARYKYGADEVIAAVEDLMKARGDRLAQQDYLGTATGSLPYLFRAGRSGGEGVLHPAWTLYRRV